MISEDGVENEGRSLYRCSFLDCPWILPVLMCSQPWRSDRRRRHWCRGVRRTDFRPRRTTRQSGRSQLLGHLVPALPPGDAGPGRLLSEYHSQGLELIGMSVDRPDYGPKSSGYAILELSGGHLEDAKVNDFGTPSVLPKRLSSMATG